VIVAGTVLKDKTTLAVRRADGDLGGGLEGSRRGRMGDTVASDRMCVGMALLRFGPTIRVLGEKEDRLRFA